MKKFMLSGALVAALAMPSAAAAADEPTPTEFKNASKQCKAMKKAAGAANFKSLHISHGKCVSKIAKQKAATEEKQEKQAKTNASKQCKELRDQNKEEFAKFKNFGQCVSQKAKQNKAEADKQEAEQDQNRVNAAKQCKEEQKNATKFAADYGSKKNAFGKCVSKKAQAQNDEPAQG